MSRLENPDGLTRADPGSGCELCADWFYAHKKTLVGGDGHDSAVNDEPTKADVARHGSEKDIA